MHNPIKKVSRVVGEVVTQMRDDLTAAVTHDPAARNTLEVALVYSGVHAVWAYRVAHRMWAHESLKLPARILAQTTRAITGVEIHPGAKLGSRLFIDHGMGVVIGETAEVGEDVTIYHGTTLGGTSLHQGKRHPTVGDRVVIGSGAKVLGAITIGDDVAIGANAVVVKDVPASNIAVGIPAENRSISGMEPQVDPAYYIDPAIYI
ncbi:MAG: serine O-acetyltransferase [Actinomycetaceae bacterium]|nr:serine O-acetyltransferase [Arcanobacterium sp.]MDD7505031.1 serine O-acetyltransferase [Actinomycetaceae bacterium]